MYTNEITIVFNIYNENTGALICGKRFPHVLRVPSDELTGTPEEYLRNYDSFKQLLRGVTSYRDYYAGVVNLYIIQEDRSALLRLSDIIEPAADLLSGIREDILQSLEKCLDRFRIPHDITDLSYELQKEDYIRSLEAKGMERQSIVLYVMNDLQNDLPQNFLNKVKELLA